MRAQRSRRWLLRKNPLFGNPCPTAWRLNGDGWVFVFPVPFGRARWSAAVTISTIEVAGRGVRRQLHSDFSQLRKEGWLVVQLGGIARTLHPCPRVPMPPSVIGARDHPYSSLQRDYHESGSPRYRIGSCRRLTQRRIFSPGGGHVLLTGVPSASAVVSTIPSPRIGRNSNLASCVMRSLRQRSPRDRIRKHAAA